MPPLKYFQPRLSSIHFDLMKFNIHEYLDFENLEQSILDSYNIKIKERQEHYINKKGKEIKNFYKYRIQYHDEYDNEINILTRQFGDNLWTNHLGSITTTGPNDFDRINGLYSLYDIFGIRFDFIKFKELEISFDFEYKDEEERDNIELWFKKHVHSSLRKSWWRVPNTETDLYGTKRSNGQLKMYDRFPLTGENIFRFEITYRKKRLADLKFKKPSEIFEIDWVDVIFGGSLCRFVDIDWSKLPKKHKNKLQIVYSRGNLQSLKDRIKSDKIKVDGYYKQNEYGYELKKYLEEWNRTLQEYESPMVEDLAYLLDDL